jgi:hypothetical protein
MEMAARYQLVSNLRVMPYWENLVRFDDPDPLISKVSTFTPPKEIEPNIYKGCYQLVDSERYLLFLSQAF